ncbi:MULTISPECIES: calcium-binding protein [Pandoraea]|uniref:beta strand repeat-containing protein n=1 Tax=Pandoraea TaxID=93217 RepID=UPI001F5CF060|nr:MULTISPECIES: calcium-binding protein [Pandoraea]MCI3203846.1 hypothetical protein [Pandoraea sp. LA3]MDN4581872.1 hypothetical protein [Pandoraea capi]
MSDSIKLTQYQRDTIQLYIDNADYANGYLYVKTLVVDEISSGNQDASLKGLANWFDYASSINENDGRFVSQYVRGATEAFAALMNKPVDDARFQVASNNLAIRMLDSMVASGEIASLSDTVSLDVASMYTEFGLPTWGWSGTTVDWIPLDLYPTGIGLNVSHITGEDPRTGYVPTDPEQYLQNQMSNAALILVSETIGVYRGLDVGLSKTMGGWLQDLADALGRRYNFQPPEVSSLMSVSGEGIDPAMAVIGMQVVAGAASSVLAFPFLTSSNVSAKLFGNLMQIYAALLSQGEAGLLAIGGLLRDIAQAIDTSEKDNARMWGADASLVAALRAERAANNARDPIVLDLSGTGIHLTELSAASPYFDIEGDGFSRKTGWIGEGMGLLVFSPAAGGVTTGKQLVASFAQLSEMDSNGDGVIDISDAGFSALRVWVDANGDATNQAGELFTLAEIGIKSISLAAVKSDVQIAGNSVNAIGTYTLQDGSVRDIAAVSLVNNPSLTRPDEATLVSGAVAALPQLVGHGTLADLHSSMMSNNDLRARVEAFQALPLSSDAEIVEAAAESILIAWSGVPTADTQTSRLAFLEKYTGVKFDGGGTGLSGVYHAQPSLNQAWNALFDAGLARLILQSPNGIAWLPEFTYDAANDLIFPTTDIVTSIQGALARLGAVTETNFHSWEIFLRALDAYRMEIGLGADTATYIVSTTTDGQLGSVANAIFTNLSISLSNHGIVETGTSIGDVFYAGNGISALVGNGGGETFDDSTLDHDTFIYSVGSGSVRIEEYDNLAVHPTNRLEFGAGIVKSDVTISANSSGDILLTLKSGDVITLAGMAYGPFNGVQVVAFSDGTAWSRSQIMALASGASGGATFNYVSGTTGADVLDGGAGQVFADGNGGDDTFVFNAGYGSLEIGETQSATLDAGVLRFGAGIESQDVKVRADRWGNAILTVGSPGDVVQIDGMFIDGASEIKTIAFANGDSWTISDFLQRELASSTSGADVLYGGRNADLIDGKGGDDFVSGGGGGDTFVFNSGYGNLEIYEQDTTASTNVLRFGAGISADSITVRIGALGDLRIYDGISGDAVQLDGMLSSASSGVQEVQFADGTVLSRQQLIERTTLGTADGDYLIGTSAADYFDGHGGADTVVGYGGGDTFVFNQGYGTLTINETDYSPGHLNVLRLGAGINPGDVTFSSDVSGTGITLTAGADQIVIQNILANPGASGVDQVIFNDGTVWTSSDLIAKLNNVFGSLGNDTIFGTSLAEVIDGRGGSDLAVGNGGRDTFVFNGGYGSLEIRELDYANGSTAVLQLGAGIDPNAVQVSVNDKHGVVLRFGSDQITIDFMAIGIQAEGVSEVRFANGVIWTRSEVLGKAGHSVGTLGNDSLWGTTGADVFDGQGGIDLVTGNGGADTFNFAKGYGSLEVVAQRTGASAGSTLALGQGILASDITVRANSAHDIVLQMGADSVTLDRMAGDATQGVDRVTFADGTIWSSSDLLALTTQVANLNTNDILYGTTGADLFDGKGGDDSMIGFGGGDTFVFNKGYGKLEINETDTSISPMNVLQFGAGILPGDVSVSVTSDAAILLTIGTDQVKIDLMSSPGVFGVQEVRFADGTTWGFADVIRFARSVTGTSGNDDLYGPQGNAYFDGKGGDDTVTGWSGNNTYVFNQGYGHLEIRDISSGSILQLGENLLPGQVVVSATQDNAILLSFSSGDVVRIDNALTSLQGGLSEVKFADGTIWDAATVAQKARTITGSTGADILYGTPGGDLIDGRGGNDTAYGRGGNDTYVFNAGYGNLTIHPTDGALAEVTLQFGAGISSSDLVVSRNQYDVILQAGTDTITLVSMANSSLLGSEMHFADGSVLTGEQILSMLRNVVGGAASDTLYGTDLADYIDGHGGNDVVYGNGGGDTIVFNAGYGNLEINELDYGSDPHNVLRLGPGISPASISVSIDAQTSGFVLTDGVTGDRILLSGSAYASTRGVQIIQFSDGTTWTRSDLMSKIGTIGTLGNDSLVGTSAAEYFDGRGGDDTVIGGGGADTFFFDAGYGALHITAGDYSNVVSVLQFGTGVDKSSVSVRATTNGDIVVRTGVSGDVVTLANGEMIGAGVQQVKFSDGTTWTGDELRAMAIAPTTGADTIVSYVAGHYFDGLGGGDYESGSGNDTFIYNPGYGALEISDYASSGVTNVLQFGAGIVPESITVNVDDKNGVRISDGIAGDVITIDNMAMSPGVYGVQEVQFADGTVWTAADLMSKVKPADGTTGNDHLVGTAAAELFDGLGGDDTIDGGGGGDTVVFNPGYGKLLVNEFDFSGNVVANVLRLGQGITPSSLQIKGGADIGVAITDGVPGDQIQVTYGLAPSMAGFQTIEFSDGSLWTLADILQRLDTGTAGDDAMFGAVGMNDRFDGLGGNDTITGYGGDDTYVFHSSYGQLNIVNGLAYNSTASGELDLDGVGVNQLWLERVGDDLKVAVMGTGSAVTIDGWYASDASKLSSINITGALGGDWVLDNQIDQLVQAMAAFSASQPGFDPASTASSVITDPTLLTVVSTAWHH